MILTSKICTSCGKQFTPKEPHHNTCYNCFREKQSVDGQTPQFPKGYLENGYFDQNETVFPAVIVDWPDKLAKIFGAGSTGGVTSCGLRRFYTKVKYAEQRLEHGESFDSIKATLYELKQHAANAAGKATTSSEKKAFELFKQFIDMNVDLAVQKKEAFKKGFLLHFQGLVAYFKYHESKKARRV